MKALQDAQAGTKRRAVPNPIKKFMRIHQFRRWGRLAGGGEIVCQLSRYLLLCAPALSRASGELDAKVWLRACAAASLVPLSQRAPEAQ